MRVHIGMLRMCCNVVHIGNPNYVEARIECFRTGGISGQRKTCQGGIFFFFYLTFYILPHYKNSRSEQCCGAGAVKKGAAPAPALQLKLQLHVTP